MQIPPLLLQFGSTPMQVVVGFVAANRDWVYGLCARLSDRTGVTEFSTYDPRSKRLITLNLRPFPGIRKHALALQLMLWVKRSPAIVVDETNRFLQGQAVGLDGDCSCLPATQNPHLDDLPGQPRGFFGADDLVYVGVAAVVGVVAVAFIAFCVVVAAIVLPGLMEIAAVEILQDDYYKAQEGGAEFSGDPETAVRGGVGFLTVGGSAVAAVATGGQGGLATPDVGKLVIEATDGGTRGGANAPPTASAPFPWAPVIGGVLLLVVVRG